MAKTVADVMKMVKESEVKFVDFRFTDTRGKEQHVTVPVSHFDEDKFTSGHAFDGSSIAGWKGIEASDMQLMPDPNTANIDPFFEETTMFLSCDVVEPGDGKAYDRDPRSIAKRAEAYLKASGMGDTAFFGPEPEFFIFDDVRWGADMSGSFVKIDEYEAPWNTGKKIDGGNRGHRPTVKGGYFPVPPVDSTQDLRAEISLILESLGVPVEVFHHEVGGAGQNEIGTKFSTLVQRADCLQFLRQNGNLYAQAAGWRQRFGHARAPVGLERRQESVCRRRLRRPVRVRAVLHRRHHQTRARAECDHQSGDQQLQAPGAGL
jgi:glutamine synthetase